MSSPFADKTEPGARKWRCILGLLYSRQTMTLVLNLNRIITALLIFYISYYWYCRLKLWQSFFRPNVLVPALSIYNTHTHTHHFIAVWYSSQQNCYRNVVRSRQTSLSQCEYFMDFFDRFALRDPISCWKAVPNPSRCLLSVWCRT